VRSFLDQARRVVFAEASEWSRDDYRVLGRNLVVAIALALLLHYGLQLVRS
jgi:hypothetical protein